MFIAPYRKSVIRKIEYGYDFDIQDLENPAQPISKHISNTKTVTRHRVHNYHVYQKANRIL